MKKGVFIAIVLAIILGTVGIIYLYQYTEVFGKKLIPLKIESIEVQYIPGYDIEAAEQFISDEKVKIDVQKIQITGEDLITLKKELRDVRKSKQKNEELYPVRYKVIINEDLIMKVGNAAGDLQKDKEIKPIIVPASLDSHIEKLIDDNNKSVVKKISTETVKIKMEGASITIKSQDNLTYVKESLNYYPIHIDEDYKNYEGGYKITLFLDNNVQVYLYNEKIGYIAQKDGDKDISTYAIFTEDLYELINKIYDVSINK
ncbi:MAG: hypothetical protein IKF71_04830 [Bacilli bacterium]|nr:hypothetical protein [Bacilli bacterium]